MTYNESTGTLLFIKDHLIRHNFQGTHKKFLGSFEDESEFFLIKEYPTRPQERSDFDKHIHI